MLDRLRRLFAQQDTTPAPPADDPNRALKVAACALLLEMAYADDEFTADERQRIEDIVGRHFAVGADSARALMEAADLERRQATDLFQLTSVITRQYDEGQRLLLSELLWRVVYADGVLSEHEDYLTQKLAVLLDLRPGYLAEARKRARD